MVDAALCREQRGQLDADGFCVVERANFVLGLDHEFGWLRHEYGSRTCQPGLGGYVLADPSWVSRYVVPAVLRNEQADEALTALGLTDVRIRTFRMVLQPAGADALSWTRSLQRPEQYDLVYLADTLSRRDGEVEVVDGSHRDTEGGHARGSRAIHKILVPRHAVLIVNARTQWRLAANDSDADTGFMLVRYVPGFSRLGDAVQAEVARDFPAPPRRWWYGHFGHDLWPLVPLMVPGRPAQRPARPVSSGSAGWL